jgi:GT2 family glycosyltransferase
MTIIGIPVYNGYESFKAMFDSLLNSTDAFDKIYIIESSSTDGTAEYCDILMKIFRRVEVIHTKKEGPLTAINMLFNIAKEQKQDLFLTQSDVLFPRLYKRDWLQQMKEAAQKEDCGLVTCLNGCGVSGPDYLEGLNWVGGWCIYIPYRAIEKVGGYDINYPQGWGVDIDYTISILNAGFNIHKIYYWVDHHMINDREHDADEEGKKAASKYFKKKWKL